MPTRACSGSSNRCIRFARVVRRFSAAFCLGPNTALKPLRSTTSAAETIVLLALYASLKDPHYPYERIHQSKKCFYPTSTAPPFTLNTSPVMNPAYGVHRNRMGAAISSGVATRPSGMVAKISAAVRDR